MATGSGPGGPTILVVGATGDLGQCVVRRLRAGALPVRALVRPNTDPGATVPEGVVIVRGDLTDPAGLFPACAGVTTVVLTATAIGRRLAGERLSIRDVDQRGGLALVDAAESAGVTRFVFMSFPGADVGAHTPLEQAKLAIEERLRASTMQPVIVRADAFQEIHLSPVARFDIARGKVSIIGRGDCQRRWIATEDVAALVAALTVETNPPEVVEVGGPEPISKNTLVEVAERISGRRMKTQHMPRQLARIVIALTARFNDALASALGAGLQQDLLPASWDDAPLRDRGIQPQSPTDYVTRIAAPTG
jgi:uncharacterized protein YbjT (DUF2867 family)